MFVKSTEAVTTDDHVIQPSTANHTAMGFSRSTQDWVNGLPPTDTVEEQTVQGDKKPKSTTCKARPPALRESCQPSLPLKDPKLSTVMVVTKAWDKDLVHRTRDLTLWLLQRPHQEARTGITVYVDDALRDSKLFGADSIIGADKERQERLRYWTPDLCRSRPETFDLVLTLGGDGTVLFTSWLFQGPVPPVLPFGLGSLGFLTPFDFDLYPFHLDQILDGPSPRLQRRMRLACTVYRRGPGGRHMDEGERYQVLNEVVFDRGPSPFLSNLAVYADGEPVTVVQADGCILSTPTGSTAYSLSAGGPLVHAALAAVVLTPICPHTLSFRPLTLPANLDICILVPPDSRGSAFCTFDGKQRTELRRGDRLLVSMSPHAFPLVARAEGDWFDQVRRRLLWNSRAASQKPLQALGADDADDDDDDNWPGDVDSAYVSSYRASASASPFAA